MMKSVKEYGIGFLCLALAVFTVRGMEAGEDAAESQLLEEMPAYGQWVREGRPLGATAADLARQWAVYDEVIYRLNLWTWGGELDWHVDQSGTGPLGDLEGMLEKLEARRAELEAELEMLDPCYLHPLLCADFVICWDCPDEMEELRRRLDQAMCRFAEAEYELYGVEDELALVEAELVSVEEKWQESCIDMNPHPDQPESDDRLKKQAELLARRDELLARRDELLARRDECIARLYACSDEVDELVKRIAELEERRRAAMIRAKQIAEIAHSLRAVEDGLSLVRKALQLAADRDVLIAAIRDAVLPEGAERTFARASVVQAACFWERELVGVVILKVGRIGRDGQVRLSGGLIGLDGRKRAMKGVRADGSTGRLAVSALFGDSMEATLRLDANGLHGVLDGCAVRAAAVGGTVDGAAEFDFGDVEEALAGISYQRLLFPVFGDDIYRSVPVARRGRAWTCAKAAQMKWVRDSSDASGGSWVDTGRGGDNLAGLKLSYNPSSGIFKGSFYVYTDARKVKAVVSGLCVDGKGLGLAELRKPAAVSWSVSVE